MFERIVVVIKKTSLEELLARHYSREQAQFFLKTRGGNIGEYEESHSQYYWSLAIIREALPSTIQNYVMERDQIASFLFRDNDLVIVIGPDGLCANVAKYASTQVLLTINPDARRIDGKLMLFTPRNAAVHLPSILKGEFITHELTLAQASTNDGQTLFAVNDFLIGRRDHISARYTISYAGRSERQSSSGVLVSTGVGSSGWLSSVINGSAGVMGMGSQSLRAPLENIPVPFAWDADHLTFVVREPFRSTYTGTSIVVGKVDARRTLEITSEMPEGGVVFSDGVPEDSLEFNSGSKLTITLASVKARVIAN